MHNECHILYYRNNMTLPQDVKKEKAMVKEMVRNIYIIPCPNAPKLETEVNWMNGGGEVLSV